jgi:hypothetical protein
VDLSAFLDVNPEEPETVVAFFDGNALSHIAINSAFMRGGVVLQQSPLWTEGANKDWLMMHAEEHRMWSRTLGIADLPGADATTLETLDVNDPDAVAAWQDYHYQHTALVAQALGL